MHPPQPIALRLDIVNRPVIPVPEAAYAVLRSIEANKRECILFAWGPEASRIELTNPGDLLTGTVARRAVFQWTDTVIFGQRPNYGVQKINPNGATHFPELTSEAF